MPQLEGFHPPCRCLISKLSRIPGSLPSEWPLARLIHLYPVFFVESLRILLNTLYTAPLYKTSLPLMALICLLTLHSLHWMTPAHPSILPLLITWSSESNLFTFFTLPLTSFDIIFKVILVLSLARSNPRFWGDRSVDSLDLGLFLKTFKFSRPF